MSPITKDRISSPLEAGKSLLELRQLPLQLTVALDYVSSRLARKGLHLSMIVVRKDVNVLPIPPSPEHVQSPRESPTPSASTSPARSLFNTASSTFTKTLSKHSSNSSISEDGLSASSSPSAFSFSRWPGLPSSPKLGLSPRLATSPSPPPSPRPISPPMSQAMNEYGISLLQTSTLTPKAEKALRRIISKAEKKLSIGSGWLPAQPLSNPLTCRATNDLIRRSLTQNSILFSSEGLTLLSLDHIYDFKCLLHTYSSTLSSLDLTSAVDGLRRLVLSQNGRKVTKGYLLRIYEWLSVSPTALSAINEAYKLAYGGKALEGGIDMQIEEKAQIPTPIVLQKLPEARKPQPSTTEVRKQPILPPMKEVRNFKQPQLQQSLNEARRPKPIPIPAPVLSAIPIPQPLALPTKKIESKPTLLNLQTSFLPTSTDLNRSIGFVELALNTSTSSSFAVGIASPTLSSFTNSTSTTQTSSSSASTNPESLKPLEIGESAKGRDYHAWSLNSNSGPNSEDKGPHMRGPMTPNGWEDCTPMTKGEWSFLKDGFVGRTGGVGICA